MNMKMIMAIVTSDDSHKVTQALNLKGYIVTKLSSTGGFLRTGNTTLMICTEQEKHQDVIDIIEQFCQVRKQITTISPIIESIPMPIEVEVGGATIFVWDVEKMLKV